MLAGPIEAPRPGETVTCGRNIVDLDSPGCQIEIDDFQSGKTLMDVTKKKCGTYTLNGSWDVKETIPRDVSNVNISLDLRIVTPPAGAVSLSRTFDLSKTASNSALLQTGSYRLAWQDDGTLVVYRGGGFNDNKWMVPTYRDQDPDGFGGDRLFLVPEGNLVVLNSNNRALWQTGAPK